MPDEARLDQVVAAYDELVDALFELDEAAVAGVTERLISRVSALDSERVETAVDIAIDLLDGWAEAEEAAGASSPAAVERFRLLITDVVVRLADTFAHPVLDGLGIEFLNEADSPQAATRALAVLADRGPTMDDDLGESVIRALIAEATRQEDRDQTISVEITDGLRACLGQDRWLPEPLTPSDLAAVVAWADFTRDDLRRLEATMAGATGPFSNAHVAAQAALLRVMVPFTHADVIGMERELRQAAAVVKEADDPGLVTTYRLLVQMIEESRGGARHADFIGELEGQQSDQGKVLDDSVRILSDCMVVAQQILGDKTTEIPDELRARVEAWCATPVQPGTDAMTEAFLWWIGHAFALLAHDRELAAERLQKVVEICDGFGAGAPQAIWFEPLIAALAPALGLPDSSSAEVQAQRRIGQRHRDAGYDFVAYLADVRLAIVQADRDPQEALAAALRALDFRRRHLSTLPGSSERVGLRGQLRELIVVALRSAASIGDPRLMAELLEYLRAQDMPVVAPNPDAANLPFGMLLPPAAFGDRAHAPIHTPESEAVLLGPAPRVRMPWGTIALSEFLPPTNEPCADLVIPVRREL